jgi:hypothetical protein
MGRGSQDESGKVEEPAQVLNTRCSNRGHEQGREHGREGKRTQGLTIRKQYAHTNATKGRRPKRVHARQYEIYMERLRKTIAIMQLYTGNLFYIRPQTITRTETKHNFKPLTDPPPTAPFSAESVGIGVAVGLSVVATVPVPVVAPVGRAIEMVEVIASDG